MRARLLLVNLVGNFDLRDGKGKASIPLRHYEAYRPQIKRRKETSKGENEKEVEEYFWSCRHTREYISNSPWPNLSYSEEEFLPLPKSHYEHSKKAAS